MSDQYLGEIRMVGFNWAPYGWALCAGQTLNINSNAALFSLIGTYYGGNGQTTFMLPNLQGRFPIGQGQAAGQPAVTIGQMAGTQETTLLLSNMPAHTHVATFTPSGGGGGTSVSIQAGNAEAAATVPTSGNVYLAATSSAPRGGTAVNLYATSAGTGTPLTLGGVTVSGGGGGGGTVTNAISGSGLPFPNMPPYLAVNFIIATMGVFPSRN